MTLLLEPGGPAALRSTTHSVLARAADDVERHLGETIPPARVRLAHTADFGIALAEAVDGGGWLRRAVVRAANQVTALRGGNGLTVATEAGHVLVLLAENAMRPGDDFAYRLAVHELVHAVQMGRPGIYADVLCYQRHNLGCERASRQWVREYLAALDRREDEAYEVEDLLAAQARKEW